MVEKKVQIKHKKKYEMWLTGKSTLVVLSPN